MDKYEKARKDFKNWASKDNNLFPFEFGKVGIKGVSDLDLGIVVRKMPTLDLKKHFRNIPESILEVMNGGTIMIFPEKNFKDILYLDNLDINFLNESVPFENINKNEENIINIIQVIEWLPERMLCLHKDMDNGFPNLLEITRLFVLFVLFIEKNPNFRIK